MLDAGALRHRVALQKYDGGTDDYGDLLRQDDSHWQTMATVWAAVDPVSGREYYAAEQAQSEVTHKVRLRYRAGVTPGMRVLLGQRRLYIRSVIDWGERHESLLLMAQEVNNGQ